MKKIMIGMLAVLSFAFLVGTTTAIASPSSDSHVPGRVLVKFYDNHKAAESLKAFGLADGKEVGATGVHMITVPAGKEEQLVTALSHNKNVEFAEVDAVVQAESSDTFYDRQYALENTGQSFMTGRGATIAGGTNDADVDAPEAWGVTRGNSTLVAVLDSGVATDNEDISTKVVGFANFSGASSTEDNYGHGTHVAGIVAATTDNGEGVAGVCPDCTVLNVKVLNDSGVGSSSTVANGINWAVNNGAKVINMSLGSRASRTLEAAVNNAWSKGVVLVAAAGNASSTSKLYPAAYSHVISVAATNNRDEKASFSSYGTWVDVAAPGENVFSTFPNHDFFIATEYGRAQGYDVGSGTSMASPVVAGIAALTIAAHPTANNADIEAKITAGSDKILNTGTYWKYGRVNAYGAVTSNATAPIDTGTTKPGKGKPRL